MTLDEAIKHAEKTADNLEREAECIRSWGKENDTKQGVINCEKFAEEHRQLAEWLKELKQLREQTRWIPVSERLSDIDEEVLVDDGADRFVAWWVDDGLEAGWHSFDESYDPDTPILAWMPLPKSYKEESENKV